MPRHAFRTVLLTVTLLAATASGQVVTLTLDADEYVVGETVHAVLHNAGPGSAWIVSTPHFLLYNLDTEECLWGCVGLPEVTELPEGESVTFDWNTGAGPDEPGNYRVRGAVNGSAAVDYILRAAVPARPAAWGAIKALYREGG